MCPGYQHDTHLDRAALLSTVQMLKLPCTRQEWANLRAQGIKTPEIAAWQRMPPPGFNFNSTNRAKAIYPYVLTVYNDPPFQQVTGLSL